MPHDPLMGAILRKGCSPCSLQPVARSTRSSTRHRRIIVAADLHVKEAPSTTKDVHISRQELIAARHRIRFARTSAKSELNPSRCLRDRIDTTLSCQ